ncbi:MAG: spheroidene monooxygenase [Acidimicrobiia bacterium]
MTGVASFHLVRVRPLLAPAALARLGTDRRRLSRTPGLAFWRLLGTGAASSTARGVDPARTAMFAVWHDEAALDAFMGRMAPRWASAAEAYHVRLRGLGGHGAWRGFDVLGAVDRGSATGPIAVLTRATVHLRHWRSFARAGRPVSEEVRAAPGLLAVCGIGEAPVGRQGTFSLWRDAAAVRAFADEQPQHREVVQRTRAEGWYGEELFARFEPFASSGSWDGREPLPSRR